MPGKTGDSLICVVSMESTGGGFPFLPSTFPNRYIYMYIYVYIYICIICFTLLINPCNLDKNKAECEDLLTV